ncbi:MAG TPA: Ldh family oxidoreductase [Acetobacteraceae bacterium]
MPDPANAETPMNVVRLPIGEAHDLGGAALRGIGFTNDEARSVVDHLIDNSLCGYRFAGLPRILALADSPEIRQPRRPIAIEYETPISARVDGGNHVGYVAMDFCVDLAISKAGKSGVALIGAHNSWLSGRNAYYLEKLAHAGFVGIHTVASTPAVVPPGARQRFLGTNPLAIALPGEPDPFIFDMGTAATMWGEVLLKSYLNESLPDGIGVDAEGRPTNSAAEMIRGGVLPFGGHKGFGLSLAIQALGLLGGGITPTATAIDRGFLFIVFDPGLLLPRAQFTAELARLIATIKSLPRQPGVDEIRIPSERAFRERMQRRAEGFITVDRPVYERLVTLAGRNS